MDTQKDGRTDRQTDRHEKFIRNATFEIMMSYRLVDNGRSMATKIAKGTKLDRG